MGKANGACSWPLTGTEAAIPLPAMRLHWIILDSEGGPPLPLPFTNISHSDVQRPHTNGRLSASRSADCVKGGGALESWTASMLEKTQLWPNRSCSVVDPRQQLKVKGWGEGEKSVTDAFLDAAFYPRLLRLSYTTPDSNNEHNVVRIRVNRQLWSLKLSHCVLGDPHDLAIIWHFNYILYVSLVVRSNPMEQTHYWEANSSSPSPCLAFYETRKSITAFTKACHLSRFPTWWIQPMPFYPVILRAIVTLPSHLCLVLSNVLPPRLCTETRNTGRIALFQPPPPPPT